MRTLEPFQPKRARDGDQRRARLRGKALTPQGRSDPIAELDCAGGTASKTAFTYQLQGGIRPLEDEEARKDRIARPREIGLGVADVKRPWRAGQVHDDGLVGNRTGKRGRVFRETRPQQPPWRSREHHFFSSARRADAAW